MATPAKTVIVTGASRGIGAGLVEAFLNRGYSVVASSRNITKANPFAAAANVALVDGGYSNFPMSDHLTKKPRDGCTIRRPQRKIKDETK